MEMDRFPLTKAQKAMEIITWLVAVAALVWTLVCWGRLPDVVAIHYNALGAADDWGGRWTVFLWPVLLLALCGSISFCMRLGLKHVNLPFRVNMEREWYVLRAVRDMLGLVNLEIAVTFAVMQWCTLAGTNLPVWFTWVMMGVLLSTGAFGLWRAWNCNQGTM
jgi:uncharacterized membrane protein